MIWSNKTKEKKKELKIVVSTEELIEKCKSKWKVSNDDVRIKMFEEKLPDFLDEFEVEALEIILCLLDKFDYYSHQEINTRLVELHEKVVKVDGFDKEKTIFCVLKTMNGKINSSTEYVCEYWRLNKINTYSVITNIDDLDNEAWDFINTIVFIDDCCGSGKTFTDFLQNHLLVLKKKRIIYAIVHVLKDAVLKIEQFKLDQEMDISIVYCRKSEKAFTDKMLAEKKTIFAEASKNVGVVNDKDDIFGYKKTEMLIAYYNNTPNNTIGVFRKETELNKSIFPRRHEKKPGWLLDMQESKKQRNTNNYCRKVKDVSG